MAVRSKMLQWLIWYISLWLEGQSVAQWFISHLFAWSKFVNLVQFLGRIPLTFLKLSNLFGKLANRILSDLISWGLLTDSARNQGAMFCNSCFFFIIRKDPSFFDLVDFLLSVFRNLIFKCIFRRISNVLIVIFVGQFFRLDFQLSLQFLALKI